MPLSSLLLAPMALTQEVIPLHIPHPGQLRHMVEIGQTVNTVGENGYPEATDQVICRVWAGAEDDSSRYFFSADAENAERGLVFIIRWRSDIQPGMWVRWNGEKQLITKLGEYDFRRRYMKLTTEAVVGRSKFTSTDQVAERPKIPQEILASKGVH